MGVGNAERRVRGGVPQAAWCTSCCGVRNVVHGGGYLFACRDRPSLHHLHHFTQEHHTREKTRHKLFSQTKISRRE